MSALRSMHIVTTVSGVRYTSELLITSRTRSTFAQITEGLQAHFAYHQASCFASPSRRHSILSLSIAPTTDDVRGEMIQNRINASGSINDCTICEDIYFVRRSSIV